MNQPYSAEDFARLALQAFPELEDEFTDAAGGITLRMTAFARRLQQAKKAAEWDSYERGLSLVDELWRRPDSSLAAALKLTLMKGLDFDGPRGQAAWSRLSPALQHGWTSTRRHLDDLQALPRKQGRHP